MNNESEKYTALAELLTIGNEFCYFIENQSKYDRNYRLYFLQRILPAMYLKGTLLPEEEECDESFLQHCVTEENYEILYGELATQFVESDIFYTLESGTGDAVKYSVSELLADIYQDMKDLYFTFVKEQEAGKECVAYFAKKWFAERWGKSVSILLPVVHDFVIDNNTSDEFDED